MKGILICGGTGSRLRPLTDITNKSLLPVYDKPLIHYPLSVLLDAGITEIIVVTGTEHINQIQEYLIKNDLYHCNFTFKVQEKPGGIAQALGLAVDECSDGESICAILGDNLYFDTTADTIKAFKSGGHVFLKEVEDPERFGVAELEGATVVSVEEKPTDPKSNLALTGLYLFDSRCFDVIANLKPSARGELEITDMVNWYLQQKELTATVLQDEWIDAGTFESLHKAAVLVREKNI
ncbi:MAG: sugar phosphate nucleotidyltransferase [bacterium]|nr:sugar phosphate nucleotidyltransferase [bacterium]